jgi:hypothetical protein
MRDVCSLRLVRPAFVALVMVALLGSCARPDRRPLSVRQELPTSELAVQTAATGPDDAEATLILLLYWRRQAEEVKPHVEDISKRSKLFGDLAQHYHSLFVEMERVQRGGLELLARGDQDRAVARLNALWMALPVVTLQLNYVILASHAEDAGMVTTDWMAILGDMSRRTAPVLQTALGAGFDRREMETAAHRHRALVSELEERFPKIQADLARGGRWTKRGLYVADGVTMAVAAYDVLALLGRGVSRGPPPPVRFPALAGAGGAGTGVVVVPLEVMESMRELIRLGALSTATVSMGLTLMAGKPEAVGQQRPPPLSQPQAGGQGAPGPDPRIDGTQGLEHSWGQHAHEWFGRATRRSTHFEAWKALLKRAARSTQVFDWDTNGTATTAHLARMEGKWFVVQFWKEGVDAGKLATAFIPNQTQLGAILRRLGH